MRRLLRASRGRLALVLGIGAVAAAALATSALGVVGGSPDGNGHPYVGAIVWAAPDGSHSLCSGSLIGPNEVLTAAHCFPSGVQVQVSFDPEPFQSASSTWLTGTYISDPNWCVAAGTCGRWAHGFDGSDYAVVVLDQSVDGPYATLPGVGYDDTLGKNQQVEIVGYGLQVAPVGHTPPVFGTRTVGEAKIIPGAGSNPEFLKVSSNRGETCEGDSGGPILVGDTIVATVSYGTSPNCQSVSYNERTDTAELARFLGTIG